jgi:hypothetical protein
MEELPGRIGMSRAVAGTGHKNQIKENTRCLMVADEWETHQHKKQDTKCGASTVVVGLIVSPAIPPVLATRQPMMALTILLAHLWHQWNAQCHCKPCGPKSPH